MLIPKKDEEVKDTPKLKSNRGKAILFMNISHVFLFLYMASGKYAINKYSINVLDMCLFRTFTVFVVSSLIAWCSKVSFYVEPQNRRPLLLRSIFGTIGFTTFLFAVSYLPLGIHMILFNTNPFIAAFVGWLMLGEKPSRTDIVCMVFCFCGIAVIALSKPATQKDLQLTMTNKLIGSAFSISVAIMYALIASLTRSMQAVHYSIVLWYYAIFSVAALVIILLVETWVKQQPLRVLNIDRWQLMGMVLPSFFNTLMTTCNTIALQNEKSGFITMIGYISIVYSFLGDVFLFEYSFSTVELGGVTLVVCVLLFLMSQSIPALRIGSRFSS